MLIKERDVLRIAIIDLYNGEPNEGIRCIHDLIRDFSIETDQEVITETFAIRSDLDVPDLSFDLYLSSGGPGSPLDTKGMAWDTKYFEFIDSIEAWNKLEHTQKKYVFFICHSFQMICRHYNFAEISLRQPSSYGIFPVDLLESGMNEPVFENLNDHFYAADFRMYQVIRPDLDLMKKRGYTLLAQELDPAPGVSDKAITAVRFSEYFIGTQFHPEADPAGMLVHFKGAKKQPIIDNVGQAAYDSMMKHLEDSDKIARTRNAVLPNFLKMASQYAFV